MNLKEYIRFYRLLHIYYLQDGNRQQRIPYMLIVGDREQSRQEVSVRSRVDGELGASSVADFVARIGAEIRDRR